MNRRLSQVVRIALVLLILAALVVFARTVQWREAWHVIRNTSPTLLTAAILVNLLSLAVKSVRWWIFLRPIGVTSPALAARGTFIGAGLNNVLVANGGEAARVVFVSRSAHVASASVLATLALERLFEMVGYVLLLAIAVSVLSLPPALHRMRPFALAALVGMTALLVYLVRHPEQTELPALEGEGMLHKARAYGRNFLRTITGVSSAARFAGALACSVVAWALQVFTYHLTALAAHMQMSLVGSVAALLAVNIGFAIRATPGNVGVFQMLYAVTAASFAMDKDQAIGVALLIQIQQILPVTLIGVLLAPQMIFQRRHVPRPENVLPGEPSADAQTS